LLGLLGRREHLVESRGRAARAARCGNRRWSMSSPSPWRAASNLPRRTAKALALEQAASAAASPVLPSGGGRRLHRARCRGKARDRHLRCAGATPLRPGDRRGRHGCRPGPTGAAREAGAGGQRSQPEVLRAPDPTPRHPRRGRALPHRAASAPRRVVQPPASVQTHAARPSSGSSSLGASRWTPTRDYYGSVRDILDCARRPGARRRRVADRSSCSGEKAMNRTPRSAALSASGPADAGN